VVAALKVEEEDNAATPNELGWLQNESFATAIKTDDARYSAYCCRVFHLITSKIVCLQLLFSTNILYFLQKCLLILQLKASPTICQLILIMLQYNNESFTDVLGVMCQLGIFMNILRFAFTVFGLEHA